MHLYIHYIGVTDICSLFDLMDTTWNLHSQTSYFKVISSFVD